MEQLRFPVTKKEAEKAGIPYSSEANKNALFPSRLRALREEKGVSQAGLAAAMGVSKSTIGLYETGDTLPDVRTADMLAGYFKVSADYLIGRTNVRSTDAELQGICKKTGLSEDAVLLLISINDDGNNQLEQIEALNEFLSEHLIRNLIYELACIRKHRLETCTFLHNIQAVIDTGETEDGPIDCTIDELKDRALIHALKLQSAHRFSRFEIIDTFTKLIDNLYMTIDWDACFAAFVTDSFMGRATKEAREIGDIDFAEFLEGIGGYSGRYS